MKSIGTRVAVWYGSTATATLACLFAAGYLLLERQLIHGLDLLNEAGFRQIDAHLGSDYRNLSPAAIETRIREITDQASTLFYIDVHLPGVGAIFRSTNLGGRDLPDVPGERHFTVEVPGIGELRVAELHKMPFEVSIATPLRPVRDVMASYVRVCLILLAAMMVASVLIGRILARVVLWPVRLMRDTANRIRSDNLSERIPVPEVRDEIADLARLLNQMFDRLESSFLQIRRFTSDASHELKIPLSLIRLHAEKMLMEGGLSPAQKEAVHVQLEEIARLNRIIEELLFLSRADANALKLDLKAQDPGALMQTFAQDASVLTEHHNRRFNCEHQGAGTVALESKWIRQVLLNLLTNAIHASPMRGEIRVHSVLADGVWRLSVEDQGVGVPPEQRDRIFDRFVRLTRPEADYQGSGLGLAICRSIVELHGGRISAYPGAGARGLRVEIELPGLPPERNRGDQAAVPSPIIHPAEELLH
jgi:two-component system heavy metal sensor histidine kinase CusS